MVSRSWVEGSRFQQSACISQAHVTGNACVGHTRCARGQQSQSYRSLAAPASCVLAGLDNYDSTQGGTCSSCIGERCGHTESMPEFAPFCQYTSSILSGRGQQ